MTIQLVWMTSDCHTSRITLYVAGPVYVGGQAMLAFHWRSFSRGTDRIGCQRVVCVRQDNICRIHLIGNWSAQEFIHDYPAMGNGTERTWSERVTGYVNGWSVSFRVIHGNGYNPQVEALRWWCEGMLYLLRFCFVYIHERWRGGLTHYLDAQHFWFFLSYLPFWQVTHTPSTLPAWDKLH